MNEKDMLQIKTALTMPSEMADAGEDYASPVKYWIPVKGAIGIHDASWRSTYGGQIYIRNGSHGCINTPLEQVSQLYDMVEIGTPCVMFY